MYSIESCFDKSIGAIKGFRRKDMSMNGWKSSEIGLRQSESVLSREMTAENFGDFMDETKEIRGIEGTSLPVLC